MPKLHPISCGCGACRGPVRPGRFVDGPSSALRLTTLIVLAIGIVAAALLEALA